MKDTIMHITKQVTFTCSKLTIKTPGRRHADVILVFLLLTLNMLLIFSSVLLLTWHKQMLTRRTPPNEARIKESKKFRNPK